jgi:hypothetical protein
MLLIRSYETAKGKKRWEYKIIFKDANNVTQCKNRKGFESQEKAVRAAEIMLGILRLPKNAYR